MKKSPYQVYSGWWVGKWCRNTINPQSKFRLVVDVELIGPPSFVYGDVQLIYSDGTRESVRYPTRQLGRSQQFRPYKKDVIALTIEEYHKLKNEQS